jgi:hypothetical protein
MSDRQWQFAALSILTAAMFGLMVLHARLRRPRRED